MGGEPWFYFVPYQSDVNGVLHSLWRREFQAGRYNPATPLVQFPGRPIGSGAGRTTSVD